MGKPKEGTQRVNLFLTPGLVQKAKGQALNKGVSFSQIVDEALEAYLPPVITISEEGDKKEMDIKFIAAKEARRERARKSRKGKYPY